MSHNVCTQSLNAYVIEYPTGGVHIFINVNAASLGIGPQLLIGYIRSYRYVHWFPKVIKGYCYLELVEI